MEMERKRTVMEKEREVERLRGLAGLDACWCALLLLKVLKGLIVLKVLILMRMFLKLLFGEVKRRTRKMKKRRTTIIMMRKMGMKMGGG